ncbi:MAG: LuxR C-terminal-related transcriptional regulator [Phaeospirillum sp.]|nr:LuxR C-terminal-related transcriptional regulator [Phaeospirillum sp.]
MRIMLIEDHSLVREGYVQMLRQGLPAVELVERTSLDLPLPPEKETPTDLVIVNFEIIGGIGLSRLSALLDRFARTPVAIIDGPALPEVAVAVHNSGAAGYLPKTMRGDAILQALRLILSGERFIPAFAIGSHARPARPLPGGWVTAEPSGPIASLSPRRRQILGMVAGGAPNKVIARALSVHEVTVKSHLRAIYRTLGVSTRTQAARQAMFAGLPIDGAAIPPKETDMGASSAIQVGSIQ